MEKGSFHPSAGALPKSSGQTKRVQELEDIVSQIALPNELPKGLDFAPSTTPKFSSSALDTAISQNEDLMARLSVSLRKTTFLEERSASLESENASLMGRLQALEEKMLILQEKDRMNSLRSSGLHEEALTAKTAANRLERLYADLYIQAQGFQRRVVSLERYRARVRRAAGSIKERARRVPNLEQKIECLENSRRQFAHGYEVKLSEARNQVEEMRAKANERDQILQDKILLENKLLFEQRQFQQSRQFSQQEVERLEAELGSARRQLKEELVKAETQRLELERLKFEVPDLQEEAKALREQVESLQALWGQKELEFGKQAEKNRNLQNLNQALSANLNLQRKEIQSLKAGMEKEIYTKQERIKTLQTEIEMLRHQARFEEA